MLLKAKIHMHKLGQAREVCKEARCVRRELGGVRLIKGAAFG